VITSTATSRRAASDSYAGLAVACSSNGMGSDPSVLQGVLKAHQRRIQKRARPSRRLRAERLFHRRGEIRRRLLPETSLETPRAVPSRPSTASRRQHQRNPRLLRRPAPRSLWSCPAKGWTPQRSPPARRPLRQVPARLSARLRSLDGRRFGQHHGDRWLFARRMLIGIGSWQPATSGNANAARPDRKFRLRNGRSERI
jgi:hypothetical protein